MDFESSSPTYLNCGWKFFLNVKGYPVYICQKFFFEEVALQHLPFFQVSMSTTPGHLDTSISSIISSATEFLSNVFDLLLYSITAS